MANVEVLSVTANNRMDEKQRLIEQSRPVVEEAIQLKRQVEDLAVQLEELKALLKETGKIVGEDELPGLVPGHKAVFTHSEKRILDADGLELWLLEDGHPERLKKLMKPEIGPIRKAYGDSPFKKYGEIIPLPYYSVTFKTE